MPFTPTFSINLGKPNILIKTINQRLTPYRLGTTDKIQAKVEIFLNSRPLKLNGLPVEFWLNYPSGWQKYTESTTDRNGTKIFYQSCTAVNNINCCLGYSKVKIDGDEYISNITRFNFINPYNIKSGENYIFENQ